ncbi:MAG: AAA family ATPase [Clostridia bacterium]|nr:AAA family ATPase [Clostridia bacterium]
MSIKKIKILNFKCFRRFETEFNPGLNILVGDNESGKSTILEAIHLALTGIYCGRGIKNEISPYLINSDAIQEYLVSFNSKTPISPPGLMIEIYFNGSIDPAFEGNDNTDKQDKVEGFRFEIAFAEQYKEEYEKLVQSKEIKSLPTEYYIASWTNFGRTSVTTRMIPMKSVFIDSSNYRYQNGSDVYISRIVKDLLEPDDVIAISQAHRRMIDGFANDPAIENINAKISAESTIVRGDVTLSADQGSKNAWESSLITQISGVPFTYIGKGAQCVIKTELALSHKKASNAEIILLEEPESHLSYSRLNELISIIADKYGNKQILVSTHSSFVANKLGLSNLILLKNAKTTRITELESADFFQKIAGYDTLRLVLCRKAILVEGASDELIVQRAYMDLHNGRLPIADGVDVISVGLTFLRFLELADKLGIPTYVVTDNDGDVDALKKKYFNYLGEHAKQTISICFDETVDGNENDTSKYNYNTLEPKLLKENSLDSFNVLFGKNFTTEDELRKCMKNNKTECALAIFGATERVNYPEYILKAVRDE